MKKWLLLLALVLLSSDAVLSSDYMEAEKRKNIARSKFWSEKGYNFNPELMTAYMMDQKVKDIERGKFWEKKGYNFNPEFMTAYMMDQKVKDIERAQYWKSKGYDFNAELMTAYMMDQKVKDIERAKFWKEKGHVFDPETMTAYMMDQAVKANNSLSGNPTTEKPIRNLSEATREPQKEIVYVPVPMESGGLNLYLGTGDETSIQSVSDGGRIITLLDNSIWEVSPIDTVTTSIWLPVTEVVVVDGEDPSFPYKMINKDDGETADVKLISQ